MYVSSHILRHDLNGDISTIFSQVKMCSALIICDTSLAYFHSLSCPAVNEKFLVFAKFVQINRNGYNTVMKLCGIAISGFNKYFFHLYKVTVVLRSTRSVPDCSYNVEIYVKFIEIKSTG